MLCQLKNAEEAHVLNSELLNQRYERSSTCVTALKELVRTLQDLLDTNGIPHTH
ncbi:hypothetical protein CALCODRAFT_494924 [Calocera cornea HHB12733]|uniref:Uncharacterized protein n=1 Tax=Calocera cornea HHB12733 TaxID=1353952 RepID=A0A165GSP9_9BASI|nr:hypothetical protein CALCODRAFT_494924 [Calocera cornea HHB12733]